MKCWGKNTCSKMRQDQILLQEVMRGKVTEEGKAATDRIHQTINEKKCVHCGKKTKEQG